LGNEEHIHKGHIHWHFVPRYRRPINFSGTDFQWDDDESRKKDFSTVHKRITHAPELRKVIKEEILKYLN